MLRARLFRWRYCAVFTLCALLIIAASVAAWELALEDRLATKRWGVVERGLIYRSGRLPSDRIEAVLAGHGIRVLVDLTESEPPNPLQSQERAAAAALGIEYHNFSLIGDGTGDIACYARAIATICRARREGKPLLVHCAAGAQRTGGVVAIYRVLIQGALPGQARAELQHYGWKPGRDQVLLDYLNRNMARLAELLLEMRVIDSIPNPLPVL